MPPPPLSPEAVDALEKRVLSLTTKTYDHYSEEELEIVARKLGFLSGGRAVKRTDMDALLLMEATLSTPGADGKTPRDRALEAEPSPQSAGWRDLKAMADSRPVLFRVKAVLPGYGVRIFDEIRGAELDVATAFYRNFEKDETIRMMGFLARVGRFAESAAFTGYPVPLLPARFEEVLDDFREAATRCGWNADPDRWSRQEEFEAVERIIRSFRRTRVEDYELAEEEALDEDYEPEGSVAKVGRNDPCPCGSGRKFKKCCGKSA